MTQRRTDGETAESMAATFLQRQGLHVVARNHHCRSGEIDLIARDGATLVFIEVRLRRSTRFGGAAASVDRAKQARIIRAARHYLMGKSEQACRFDVLLLDALDPSRIRWLRDAFGE